MPRKTGSVRIQDVAKVAGVSVSTISRVLNGKVDVAEDTQKHVLEVIQQLGYSSTLAARSMRSSRTNLIGLIVPDVEHAYSLEVLRGSNHAVASTKYDLLIYTTGTFQKQDTAFREQHYISLLNGTITDGVIVVTPSANSFSTNAPLVSIDPHVIAEDVPTIYCDHYQGASAAVRYLTGLGHRRIAYITGRAGMQNEQRYQAYCDMLAEAGIEYDPQLVIEGDYSIQTGAECARTLLSMSNRPTAIFAANDQSALGVFETAKDMGFCVPEELSVVGFDNIPDARYFGLTTVEQPLARMGAMAVEMLIDLIEGRKPEMALNKMHTRLIIRESCKSFSSNNEPVFAE